MNRNCRVEILNDGKSIAATRISLAFVKKVHFRMFYLVLSGWTVVVITGWALFACEIRRNIKSSELELAKWRFPLAAITLIVPTMIFFTTTVFLFQSHPTAQFNGGDDYRMNLWSLWLHGYPTIVCSSMGVMVLDAAILLSATFIRSVRKICYIAAASLISSEIGFYVLAHAAPNA